MAEKGKYVYDWPRPMVTVDSVVWTPKRMENEEYDFQILLIKRKNEPYKDCWALPGGYLEMDEEVLDGAKRELLEETGLSTDNGLVDSSLFLCFKDKVDRDPRGRTISFAYSFACSNPDLVKPGDDASEAKWFSVKDLPQLAFDHIEIIKKAFGFIVKDK